MAGRGPLSPFPRLWDGLQHPPWAAELTCHRAVLSDVGPAQSCLLPGQLRDEAEKLVSVLSGLWMWLVGGDRTEDLWSTSWNLRLAGSGLTPAFGAGLLLLRGLWPWGSDAEHCSASLGISPSAPLLWGDNWLRERTYWWTTVVLQGLCTSLVEWRYRLDHFKFPCWCRQQIGRERWFEDLIATPDNLAFK